MIDEVVQEVRAAREAFAQAHGYDAHAMVATLQRMNEAGDWPVVNLPPRRSWPSGGSKAMPNRSHGTPTQETMKRQGRIPHPPDSFTGTDDPI